MTGRGSRNASRDDSPDAGDTVGQRGVPWRNAAWIAGVATLITALGTLTANVVGLFDGGPDPTPSPTQSVSASPTPSASHPGGLAAVSDGTLDVAVSLAPADDPRAGEAYAFPPNAISPTTWPNQMLEIGPFARSHGGAAAGSGVVELVLRTRQSQPLVVTRILPRVVEARTLGPIDYVAKNAYGCGVMPVREAEADFDAQPPTVVYRPGDEENRETDSLILSVSQDEPEIITVTARTTTHDVRWEIVLTYESGSTTKDLVVRANGEPFVVTGAPDGVPIWSYRQDIGLEVDTSGIRPWEFC